jgi:hypothetical protein
MAFDQIATSVSILSSGLKGYQSVSLTDITLTTASAIAAGSAVEVANAFFLASADITINASSWTAITTATTAWLTLSPSGSAGSQILSGAWSSSEPIWADDKQGYYASAASTTRVVALAYKEGTSSYRNKTILPNIQGSPVQIRSIPIGNWNMDTTTTLSVYHGLTQSKISNICVQIIDDNSTLYYPIYASDTTGHSAGLVTNYSDHFILSRNTGLLFDSASFDTASFNRGFIAFNYNI